MGWVQSVLGYVARSERAASPGPSYAVYDDLVRGLKLSSVPMPADRPVPPVAIAKPRGRPSYDNASGFLSSPFQRIPINANFALYAALREMIPILNAAIIKK